MPVEKQIEAEPYESLEKLIEPFIAMVFAKLPANVQQRWESEDLTHTWDSIGIGWRRSLAQQHDCQHDPANRQANQYDYDLTIQIQQTENCIRELELTNSQGVPSELVTKNQALDAAKARLRNLTALSKLPSFVVSDWNDLGDAKLAAILAANTLASAPFNGDRPATNTISGKLVTPEKIAEVQAYRDKHGATKAAKHFRVSRSLVNDKTQPKNKKQKAGDWTSGLGGRIVTGH